MIVENGTTLEESYPEQEPMANQNTNEACVFSFCPFNPYLSLSTSIASSAQTFSCGICNS